MNQEKSPDNLIDELISECQIYRFASELQATNDETRKTQLRSILAIKQRCEKNAKEEKEENVQQKLNNMFEKETEYALKKSWTRLNDSQKINRIKHYVQSMIMDTNKKVEYEKKLLELNETKKLKKTQVVYDEKMGIISKIEIEV